MKTTIYWRRGDRVIVLLSSVNLAGTQALVGIHRNSDLRIANATLSPLSYVTRRAVVIAG